MNKKSSRDRNKPKDGKNAKRATVAARDPRAGARNRPGFDLGGAVGDARPDDKRSVKSPTEPARDAVSGKPAKATGAMRSAVAGVRNWLRGK